MMRWDALGRRPLVVGLGVLVASLLVYFAAFRRGEPAAGRYVLARVTRGDVESTVLATGALQAIRQVDVGTRATGQLTSLKVAIGDHVQAGDLLAEIDPVLSENELLAAQAKLADLEAQKWARSANLRKSRFELERQRGLIKIGGTSRRELESADAQTHADEAAIAALDAQIAQAKSGIDIARANLSYTKIKAPIDGEVVAVLTQEGQTVVAAQIVPIILKLARLDEMTVKTQIAEADVINVKVGQSASFTVMGDPDTRHSGVLRAVEPAPQNFSDPVGAAAGAQSTTPPNGTNAAVFYNALFNVPNLERALRIGMTAQVSITLGVAKGALTIPAASLREQDAEGRYAVRVLRKDGDVEKRMVRVGVNNRVRVEVLDGLEEGESIVSAEARPTDAGAPGGAR
jgi:membrane fusion protein, macrolide-specific efflux system